MQPDAGLRASHTAQDWELKLIERLLPTQDENRDIVLAQVRAARLRWIESQGQPAVLFEWPDGVDVRRLTNNERIAAEATAMDKDGVRIHLLLHVQSGRVQELEVYREDGEAVIEFPTADDLIVPF